MHNLVKSTPLCAFAYNIIEFMGGFKLFHHDNLYLIIV
jgi:hypothetical protein